MLFAAIGGVYASCTFMQSEYQTYRTGVWCGVMTQFLLIGLVALICWWFKRQNGMTDSDGVAIQDDGDYICTF